MEGHEHSNTHYSHLILLKPERSPASDKSYTTSMSLLFPFSLWTKAQSGQGDERRQYSLPTLSRVQAFSRSSAFVSCFFKGNL